MDKRTRTGEGEGPRGGTERPARGAGADVRGPAWDAASIGPVGQMAGGTTAQPPKLHEPTPTNKEMIRYIFYIIYDCLLGLFSVEVQLILGPRSQ